ncbi:MAG: DNA alkylation repair protein [Holophagales bacterium]|nr:DNA alkylation repair protein [Holophagales bacterium]
MEEKARPAAGAKSPLKVIGVRASGVKAVARELAVRHKGALDYPLAADLLEGAAGRKVREEILVAIDLLERFRKDFEPSLLLRMDKWSSVADDLEVAEALGARVAAGLLALDPSKITTVRKWARLRSVGRKRLALLAASGLVSEGRRDAMLALDLCEILLNEDHPVLVTEVAGLLRTTTKIDAKAVQDFLFRRSIDGNPAILRAGSENLDAARRAALIAKLEAQQASLGPVAAAAGR